MKKQNVAAIYPLTPMQRALLFHSLSRGGDDMAFLQVKLRLRGSVDDALFKLAWEAVVQRHSALRMSVQTEGFEQPHLVVWRTLAVPWVRHDWLDSSESERQQQKLLEQFCRDDRDLGLDLSQPPVMRLALLKYSEQDCHLVWTCHHILLDGWSASVVIQEVFSTYEALLSDKPRVTPSACSLPDYFQWLNRQDTEAARRFWQEKLTGFAHPTSLCLGTDIHPRVGIGDLAKHTIRCPEGLAAEIQSFAKSQRLTPNSIVQAAWSLLLSAVSGDDDVVFGVTVSGRPSGLPAAETAVGLFSNALPMRVRIEHDARLCDWIQRLRDDQFELRAYEHVPLVDIQSWSEVPGHRRLFESLLVMENFPWDQQNISTGCGLEVLSFEAGVTTTYPLTLVIAPVGPWSIRCLYHESRIDAELISKLLSDYCTVLEAIVGNPDKHLAEVVDELHSRLVVPAAIASASHRMADSHSETATHQRGDDSQPPRNQLELALTRIWEQTLGILPIGVTDNYFALGGGSLVAVKIFSEIETQLSQKLPLTTLLDRPTIEQIAQMIQSDAEPARWESLVPLRAGGTASPLFCVHAGGGHVLCYRELALRMPSDQPVYALQPIGLDGESEPFTEIGDMAAHYVNEIRTVQAHGPYALAGHCLGATVCFEMAQQLHQQGEQVSLLAVLDSRPPWISNGRPARSFRARLARGAAKIRNRDWEGIQFTLQSISETYLRSVWGFYVTAFGNADSRSEKQLHNVQEACRQAYHAYVAMPYPGPITLIRTAGRSDHEFQDWYRLSPDVTSHTIPVRHTDILLEPHVAQLANILAECHRSAQMPRPMLTK